MAFVSIGEIVAEKWREEIQRHWSRRKIGWRREMIWQYVLMIRLTEDNRPDRIIELYERIAMAL